MALNQLGLGFVFTSKDLASRSLTRLGRNFESFERRAGKSLSRTKLALRNFAVGAGLALGGLVALGGGLALANQAGKFEQGMARVAAISDISKDSIEATSLETTALNSALKTQFSPTEAADGLQNFASQGFNAEQQMSALTPALRLAQAGMIPVADSAAAMTSSLKVFGLEADKSAEVTDKLLKITTKTSLQSEDLQLALGTVGRGAGLARQNLDEMLISMGLVKNTGVDTSVAASSVSSALIFMGKNADKFKDIGVSVTDNEGNFRDFADVVLDANDALGSKFPNAAKRTKVATELFGRFGVTAFQAVSNQLNTFKDASGNLVDARERLADLRTEMKNAEGTAEEFESKILDTFEGQKKILEGVLQGLAVSLGKPFAAIFKPIVSGLKGFVEGLVTFVNSIPAPIKETLAGIAVAVASLVTVLGTFVALKAGIVLLSSALGFLGISLSGLLAPALIIIAVAGALGLAFAALKVDADESGGGIFKSFSESFGKVKLFFQGLIQFFKDGEISGPVAEELSKAENQGVLKFLGTVIDFGARMQTFFDGVVAGFKSFVKAAQPAFLEFKEAIRGLGESLGFFTSDLEGAAGSEMAEFQTAGEDIGRTLGAVAVLIVQGLTLVIKTIGVVLTILDDLGLSVGSIVKIWLGYKAVVITATIAQKAFNLASGIGGVAGTLKNVLGPALTGAGGKLAGLARGAGPVIGRFAGMAGRLAGPAGLVALAGAAGFALGSMLDEKFGLSDKLQGLIGDITGLNKELKELEERAGGLTKRGAGTKELGTRKRIEAIAQQRGMSVEQFQQTRIKELQEQGWKAVVDPATGGVKIVGKITPGQPEGAAEADAAAVAQSRAGARPAEARPEMVADRAGDQNEKLRQEMVKANANLDKLARQIGQQPVNVTFEGEVLATATRNGQVASQARAFRPARNEG